VQASLTLIHALGGGWSASELPSEDQVLPFEPLDYKVNVDQPRPDVGVPDTEGAPNPQ